MKSAVHTTLLDLHGKSPWPDDFEKLMAYLGKERPDSEPLHLLTVLNATDLYFCIKCLPVGIALKYKIWAARKVLPYFENETNRSNSVRNYLDLLESADRTSDQLRKAFFPCAIDREILVDKMFRFGVTNSLMAAEVAVLAAINGGISTHALRAVEFAEGKEGREKMMKETEVYLRKILMGADL